MQEGATKKAEVRLSGPQVVIFLPGYVKSVLKKDYANVRYGIKLAEREANTFEALTQSAIETFYPEAYRRRQEFIKKSSSKMSPHHEESITEESATLTLLIKIASWFLGR